MELFLAEKPTDLLVRKATGGFGLKEFNGLVLGKNGKAMLFDGNSYIATKTNNFPSYNNEITWIFNLKTLSTNGGVFTTSSVIDTPDNKGFRIRINNNTSLAFGIGWIKDYYISLSQSLVNNEISLIITKDNNGLYRSYIDGELKTIIKDNSSWEQTFSEIGRFNNGANWFYFNGTIDEVRIYNRALSDQEIKQCFLGNCPNDDSLVLYLDFDDCTAKDKSGKGNDGTIYGNVQCVDEGILSGVQLYYPRQCFDKGAVWELWYGNPNEGGVMLAQDVVDRKWSLN
jgi:hypothetical protein